MAQSGYTPILLYASGTTTNVPLAANLTSSASGAELALNYVDGKLFYKDNAGVVQTLATKSSTSGVFTSVTDSGLTSGRVTYAGTGGLLQDSANLTFNGTTLTAAGFSGPISGVVTSTSITDSGLTSGRVTYAGTGGLLQDSANLLFNGTTLTANTIGAFTLGGTVSGGGNQLNNVIIGASTPLAGSFTTLSATTTITQSSGVGGLILQSHPSVYGAIYSTNVTPSASNYTLVTNGSFLQLNGSSNVNLMVANSSIANATSTGLAVTGTLSATGQVTATAGIVQTGSTITRIENTFGAIPPGAAGLGLEFGTSNPNSIINSYNRTTSAYTPLKYQASTHTWSDGSNNLLVLATSGALSAWSTIGVGQATPSASGAGITFPATQSASSDANTLDDYEEGTWTPTQGAGLTVVGTFSSTGKYTKIGNQVTIFGTVSGSTTVAVTASNTVFCAGLTAITSTNNAYPGLALNNGTSASMPLQVTTTTIYAAGTMAATQTINFSATYFV